jgi:ankyrin repeat protein
MNYNACKPENDKDVDLAIALREAAKYGDVDTMKSLLDSDTNIEAKDKDGRSSLILAAHHDNFEIMEILLDRGGKVVAQ